MGFGDLMDAKKWPAWKLVLAVLGLLVLASIIVRLSSTSSGTRQSATTESIGIGGEGQLCASASDGSSHPAFVASSIDNFEAALEAERKGDKYGIAELMRQGQIWQEDCGTRVMVLDVNHHWSTGITYQKVRVLSGAHEGRAGWAMSVTVK